MKWIIWFCPCHHNLPQIHYFSDGLINFPQPLPPPLPVSYSKPSPFSSHGHRQFSSVSPSSVQGKQNERRRIQLVIWKLLLKELRNLEIVELHGGSWNNDPYLF